MATKTTGAEFKAFYSDKAWWPDGTWHEDEEVSIDGAQVDDDTDLSSVEDGGRLVLANGYVTNEQGDELGSFEGYFRKWRKKQTTAFLAVEVPLDKADAVKAAIIAAGGKVKG
jgi:hypothetical protein